MTRRRLQIARVLLVALAVASIEVGIWALFFPRHFFERFPGAGRSWTAPLGVFNEHLVRDVGAFNLVLAMLFLWAAISADRRLITASALSSLLFSVPHLIFHAANLDPFSTGDAAAQMVALAFTVLAAVAAVVLVRAGTQSNEGASKT